MIMGSDIGFPRYLSKQGQYTGKQFLSPQETAQQRKKDYD